MHWVYFSVFLLRCRSSVSVWRDDSGSRGSQCSGSGTSGWSAAFRRLHKPVHASSWCSVQLCSVSLVSCCPITLVCGSLVFFLFSVLVVLVCQVCVGVCLQCWRVKCVFSVVCQVCVCVCVFTHLNHSPTPICPVIGQSELIPGVVEQRMPCAHLPTGGAGGAPRIIPGGGGGQVSNVVTSSLHNNTTASRDCFTTFPPCSLTLVTRVGIIVTRQASQ